MSGENGLLCDIRGLSVTYPLGDGARVRAVDELSLAIRGGEVVGILGESGCGKNTLAQAILGLLASNADGGQGVILLRGRDLLTMPESKLREIRGREVAMVPQDPSLALNPVINVGSQRRGAAGASPAAREGTAGAGFGVAE